MRVSINYSLRVLSVLWHLILPCSETWTRAFLSQGRTPECLCNSPAIFPCHDFPPDPGPCRARPPVPVFRSHDIKIVCFIVFTNIYSKFAFSFQPAACRQKSKWHASCSSTYKQHLIKPTLFDPWFILIFTIASQKRHNIRMNCPQPLSEIPSFFL